MQDKKERRGRRNGRVISWDDLSRVLRQLPSEGRRRIIVSTYNRSVALQVTDEPQDEILDLLPMQHLFSSSDSIDLKPVMQVVKISGNITVSF